MKTVAILEILSVVLETLYCFRYTQLYEKVAVNINYRLSYNNFIQDPKTRIRIVAMN